MRLRLLGDGPPVVKLPGIAGGSGLYAEAVEHAAAAGFRVGALDPTGDRADDPAPPERLTWKGYADEVARALDRMETPEALVWGTSYGCLTGLAFAARYPERARGLLLCHPPDPWRRRRVLGRLLRWAGRRRRPDLWVLWGFRLYFAAAMGWEFLVPPALVRLPGLYRRAREAATPASTLRRKLELLVGSPPFPPDNRPSASAHVVLGAWDRVTPAREGRRVAERLSARVTVLAACGHGAAYSRPVSYRRAVTEALRGLDAAGVRARPTEASSSRETKAQEPSAP